MILAELSASKQNYLKAVYELEKNGKGARISDIAAMIGVTKPSACLAVQVLEKKDFIKRDDSRLVYLTPAGERQAILSYDKYTIVRQFLVEVLAVEDAIAAQDALAIEQVISVDTLCCLCRFTNKNEQRHRCSIGCHEMI